MSSLNIQKNVYYNELDDNIKKYCLNIYDNLNIKIEEHCNNKETIIDFNIDISFQNIVSYINNFNHFLNNLENITKKYCDIIYKIKKYESYDIYIKKLKKK